MSGDAATAPRLSAIAEEPRPAHEIEELRRQRGGGWRVIRWIHRRRPFLTAVLVIAAAAHALWSQTSPVDLLRISGSPRFYLAWALILFGAAVRLWGSGNLRKSQEITDTGIYRFVRHPLYLGSLSLFLSYFLTVGDALVGLLLFGILVVGVYYPTMLGEEEYLTLRFPGQAGRYRPPPRLLPDVRRIPEGLRCDRFQWRAAYGNLGFRSFWFLVGLPVFLRGFAWFQSLLT